MVITLTGENSFALRQELQALTAAFIELHGDIALERLDGEDSTVERIREALASLSFLSAQKMVILRNPAANKQLVENFETLLKDLPETTELILIEPKLDKRSSFYKLLKKQTDYRDFSGGEGGTTTGWVIETAKQKGSEINHADAQYLVDRVGGSQQVLHNEIEKLSLFSENINKETIDALTEATPASTVFQLLDAAFAGNQKRAMDLYEEQRALKVEPQQIVAMLAWQLHILALAKAGAKKPAATIAKEAKVSPYVMSKSQGLARSVTLARLKELINQLLEIDLRSKSQAFDLDEALQNYLLSLK